MKASAFGSLAMAVASISVPDTTVIRVVRDEGAYIARATGNDKIRSGNTLSQKGRRKRRRQYLSQSFRKGGTA